MKKQNKKYIAYSVEQPPDIDPDKEMALITDIEYFKFKDGYGVRFGLSCKVFPNSPGIRQCWRRDESGWYNSADDSVWRRAKVITKEEAMLIESYF